jgi:Domain of unknown function (DUF4124)
MRSPIRLFIAAAILLAAATVTAQVYRWVDKDGKVQFTDVPPPANATKAEPKKVLDAPGGAAAAATPSPQKSIAEQAKEFDKRRKEQAKSGDEKAKKDEEAKKNADIDSENCRNAKSALRDLETGRPINRTAESGERYYLSEEQRQAEAARAREIAGNACK